MLREYGIGGKFLKILKNIYTDNATVLKSAAVKPEIVVPVTRSYFQWFLPI